MRGTPVEGFDTSDVEDVNDVTSRQVDEGAPVRSNKVLVRRLIVWYLRSAGF